MSNIEIDFGDFALIEQKRFGCPNELFVHKVIRTFRSNGYVEVPVRLPREEILHHEVIDVVSCICCGVDETEVFKYPLSKVTKTATQAFIKREVGEAAKPGAKE